jgi:uncharacterized membrane protein
MTAEAYPGATARTPAFALPADPPATRFTWAFFLALFAAEGGALVLFVLQILHRTKLPALVLHNDISGRLRGRWLLAMAIGGLVSMACALLAGRRAFRRPRAEAVALVLSPILALSVLPTLLTIDVWDGHELEFLLVHAVTILGAVPLFQVAAAACGEIARSPSRSFRLRFDRAAAALADGAASGAVRTTVRAAVVASAGAMAAYLSFFTIRVHDKVQTSILDLGLFDNLFWNALHGIPFYAASATVPGQSYLSIHTEALLYLFLPIYAVCPRPETLLVIQAFVAAGAAIPLYLIAEKKLGPLPGAVLAIAFLVYPPMHRPVFYDFHFLTLSSFFVLWAAYFLDARRWILFWAFAVLCMLCREDVALGLVGIGVGLGFSSYRPKTGWALAALAGAYFVGVKFALMTHFGALSFTDHYAQLLPAEDATFTGVVRTVVSNPVYTLNTLFTVEKLTLVLHVVLPVAFLCIRDWRLWFFSFPGALVTLLSTGYLPVVQVDFQYVTHFVPYVFLACVAFFVLHRPNGRLDTPSLLAVALSSAVMTSQFGALQHHSFHSGFKRIDFTWTPGDAVRLADLRAIAARIPRGASVSASEAAGAHLGRRKELYPLKTFVDDADFVLYEPAKLGVGKDTDLVREATAKGTYGVVERIGDFVLLQRGAQAAANAGYSKP